MICQQNRCLVCGEMFLARPRQQLCGQNCQRLRANDKVRAWYWRNIHGQEPPSRSSRQQTCIICGKPIDQSVGVPIKVCSPWCETEMRRLRWSQYYQQHRDRVLARQRAANQRHREAVRA